MNAFLEQLSRIGLFRLVIIFGLTAGTAAALTIFTMQMNGSNEALLYSGLSPQDAATVTGRLDSSNIEYTLRDGGASVYVSSNEVDAARMQVASDGALNFGSVGYEIFDETDALGTTSFVQNINAKRALEGELARTINTIHAVSSSRVHLVLPERQLFSRETQEPSASVVLSVQGQLSSEQVATIRNLVATAVQGLSANQITIADDQGRLLANPSDTESVSSAMLENTRINLESDLRTKIRDVVEGVTGPGAARVQVTAELNRISETIADQVYDPDTQVLASRETRDLEETERDAGGTGRVSASENIPGAEDSAATTELPTLERNDSTDTRNFLNSSTTTTRVIEAGGVERLSVSVVVDYIPEVAEDGTITYTPRSAEEMAELEALVRAAAGISEARQDVLRVSQMPFSRPDLSLGTPAPDGFSLARGDIFRIAELAILFITAMLIILLVARPLIKGAVGGGGPVLAGAGAGGSARLAGGEGVEKIMALPEGNEQEPDDGIDIDQIDGQVKKSSVKKVANLVEQHPDESMSILRNWMHESS